MAVLFQYPNSAVPMTTVTLNEVFAVVQPPNKRPYQVNVVAMSGDMYTIEDTPNRERIVRVELRALHQRAEGAFDGFEALQDFHDTEIGGSLRQFDLTDADGDMYTVRYIGGIDTVRESTGGRAAPFERFSGQLTYRVVP